MLAISPQGGPKGLDLRETQGPDPGLLVGKGPAGQLGSSATLGQRWSVRWG